MAKVFVVLAKSSEVEDFYNFFDAKVLKKNMGWKYSFNICDPDTERPIKKEFSEILNSSGLSEEIVGNFSHLIGEFLLDTRIDYDNYEMPKDFSVVICDDAADSDKLIVFSAINGFDVKIFELDGVEKTLQTLYGVLKQYFAAKVSVNDVLVEFGWSE